MLNKEIKKENSVISFNKLNNHNIINLFTLKPYNFRKETITEKDIIKNYTKLQKNINYTFDRIINPIQNHTNVVKVVDASNINDEFKDVDGLITNIPNIALTTKLADCQGILLFDTENKVIGNVHSGWKGTLTRIVSNAILLMINTYNSNPKSIEVYITPSIMQCCFEVDGDVKNMFINEFNDIDISSCIKKGSIKDNKQKYYIDTIKINKLVLLNLGIKKENIILSNICTKCNSDKIHSHRGGGINSGRNLSLISIKK